MTDVSELTEMLDLIGAKIDALQAENRELKASDSLGKLIYHDAAQKNADVMAENKRLREALKPFAKFADEMKKMGGTFPKTGTVYGLNAFEDHGAELTVEDFNQARAALGKE